MSIAKTATSTTYSPGSTITYTIAVANSGPSPATNVAVQDPLSGMQLISVTPSQGTCSGTTTVVCNLGTIANAATATITLMVRATATSGTTEVAAFDPAGVFQPAWLTLPQPSGTRRSSDGPRSDVGDVASYFHYLVDASACAAEWRRLETRSGTRGLTSVKLFLSRSVPA